jgi:acetyl esterase/lipase
MPLDRHASRILKMLAAAGGGTPASPAAVRASMLELARALDPRDLPVLRVEELQLPGRVGELAMRRYAPQDRVAPGPALLYLHGGIGVFGSAQTHDAVCRLLCADSGITLLSLDYRLAPEHPFPAAADDALAAWRWTQAQAGALGIDPARCAIGGDSAGATLAIDACRQARAAGLPLPAAQLLLCPVTDLCAVTPSRREFGDGFFPSAALLAWALDLYCPPGIDRCDARLSPLRAGDLAGLPRARIHVAEFDPFRDEGEAYAAALEAAGVDVRCTRHDGLIHHYYGMAGAIPAARVALKEAAEDLRVVLAGA